MITMDSVLTIMGPNRSNDAAKPAASKNRLAYSVDREPYFATKFTRRLCRSLAKILTPVDNLAISTLGLKCAELALNRNPSQPTIDIAPMPFILAADNDEVVLYARASLARLVGLFLKTSSDRAVASLGFALLERYDFSVKSELKEIPLENVNENPPEETPDRVGP